jgi:hypothetical protein
VEGLTTRLGRFTVFLKPPALLEVNHSFVIILSASPVNISVKRVFGGTVISLLKRVILETFQGRFEEQYV